jgi:S-adenosylmethionine:tRNA ribosyltransferase-isomerase
MHPRELSITDFEYHLPDENIAWFPLPQRDQSKLLVYEGKIIAEDIYRNIADYLPENSTVVFNDTRVVEARLRFVKDSGGEIEVFCLEPPARYPDIPTAMQEKGSVQWRCMVGGVSKWKKGLILRLEAGLPNHRFTLEASLEGREEGAFLVNFSWDQPSLSFAEVLHLAGQIPLPPYIRRKPETADSERYQTVYARAEGSVAAPTAGLHFTAEVLDSLRTKGCITAYTTLHVGAGTFQPVKSEKMEGHDMHAEFIEVNRSLVQLLLDREANKLIVVGTTSLRTIESVYWLGVKALTGTLRPGTELGQWEVYDELPTHFSKKEALQGLLSWMDQQQQQKPITKTRILIAPGYQFKMIDGLVTNFHQPSSTLLLLVAALIGDAWKELYKEAIRRKFRFLSYGDGMLVLR